MPKRASAQASSLTIGRRVRVTSTDGRRVDGMATGVDRRGALVMATDEGTQKVAFGEVAHLD